MINFFILFILPVLTIAFFVWAFRRIMIRWTGYDPIRYSQDFHKPRTIDDFYIPPRETRKRKDADTETRFDRLVDQEWQAARTQPAETRLDDAVSQATHDDPPRLGTLLDKTTKDRTE